MRETNPLKFPWKNKCINKKNRRNWEKKPVWAYPNGTDVPYRLKNSIHKDNINNLYVCEVQRGRLYLIYIFFY